MEINVSKKSFKRTLALFMAVLIAMSSVWMGIGVESFAAFEYELEVGNYVKVTASDERSYIRLEPEQTCRYILDGFYLRGFEYGVFLLDENKEIIEDLSDVIGISEGYTVLNLSAGEVYYLGVDFIGDYYEDDVLTFGLYSTFGEISENETKVFGVGGVCVYVKFVPKKSGYYEVFYETTDTGVDIDLCDAEKDFIKFVGGDSENGKIDFYLTGGDTYYFKLDNNDIWIDKISIGVKENDKGISSGETKQITLYGGNEEKLLFIPQKSGLYRFYTETSNGDYYARLTNEYNPNGGEYSYPLDDGGFELIWEIYEDNTFYYYVWNNSPTSDDEVCTIKVTLECLEELCNHKNHKSDEGKAPTCTENGYTDGFYCYDCEKWYLGHNAIWELHNDENEDNICDSCGKEMPIASGSCGGYYNEEYGWDGSAGYVLYADGTLEIRGEGTIGGDVFWYGSNFKDVIIYDGITQIADNAFAGSSIESVKIPASVTKIGYTAFDECKNLYETTVAEENEAYLSDDGALFDKDKTVLIQYPAKKATETYVVPDSVIEIDDYAFTGNKNLVSVMISDGVTSIGEGTFAGCENLQSIDISDNVKTIGDFVFSNCKSLKNIKLPEGLESFGFESFYGCESLVSIAIPSGVNEISSTAFNGCINLKEYVVDERNEYFSNDENGGLLDKEKITYINCPKGNASENYIIPDGVKTIKQHAFENCQIKGVTIPDSTEIIIGAAFENCADLKTVVMFDSVKAINDYAFSGCTNLTDVYYYGTQEDWNAIDVSYGNKALLNATIHFLGETECTHANKTSHAQQDATCTENGYTSGEYCPDCEEWISGHEVIEAGHKTSTYTQNSSCGVNGYKLTTCSVCGETIDYEIIPAGEHKFSAWAKTKEATCTVNGEESRNCSLCGEIETRPVTTPGHSWSEWKVTEATLMSAGEKIRTCSSCKVEEKVVLPKLEGEVSEDAFSGVKVEYTDGSYNGKDMNVIVEEDFTGSQYLGMSYGNFVSWNIKTYVNGAFVQPDAPVLVTIPIPSDFNKNMIVVYHVDSVTGNLEKIEPVIVEGDTIKFLASSFSIYMVVDESSVIEEEPSEGCDCNCHKSGFMGFIWKIINFFNKLFKINKTCACGEVHY